MKLSDHFLTVDYQRAGQLIDQQERFSNLARLEVKKGEFEKAELYSTHATTMIRELRRLQSQKELYAEAHDILRQLGMTNEMVLNRKDWF